MSLLQAIDIAASGMTAQRTRLDVIADNLANADTTRTPEGGPFRRKMAVFVSRGDRPAPLPPWQAWRLSVPGAMAAASLPAVEPSTLDGVQVDRIVEDPRPPRLVYDPGHPDADANGYVAYPNIDPVTEMVDMISASRAYEANVQVINNAKAMALKALEIGRG
ncbi:MAG: flagellar basal body rod protein FlgC [Firmicutes bacterium]|nr:flagellar basal body rod protein FlgC [Bacillota bacterium]